VSEKDDTQVPEAREVRYLRDDAAVLSGEEIVALAAAFLDYWDQFLIASLAPEEDGGLASASLAVGAGEYDPDMTPWIEGYLHALPQLRAQAKEPAK
jgi:hypothetical protein